MAYKWTGKKKLDMSDVKPIDANSLIKWLTSPTGFKTNCEDCLGTDCYACIIEEAIANEPTIDVVPVVHGYWRGEGDGYSDGGIIYDTWYCSECGYCIDDGTDDKDMLPKYCPGCGAKMDYNDEDDGVGVKMTGNDKGLYGYGRCPKCGDSLVMNFTFSMYPVLRCTSCGYRSESTSTYSYPTKTSMERENHDNSNA